VKGNADKSNAATKRCREPGKVVQVQLLRLASHAGNREGATKLAEPIMEGCASRIHDVAVGMTLGAEDS